MRSDRAKHNILPPSKFGVIEITRQRVKPETAIQTSEKCPTCNGTGEVQASILFAEEIESNLNSKIAVTPTEANEDLTDGVTVVKNGIDVTSGMLATTPLTPSVELVETVRLLIKFE